MAVAKGMKMKRFTARNRKSLLGCWAAAAVLALLLVGGMATPASAGNVHFSFGIGLPLPVPVYSYPAYPVYPAVSYPAPYYYAPSYPVVVGGYYGPRYYGGWRGHGHYRHGHHGYHGRRHR